MGLSSTTLARRRKAGLLTPEESDRLVRVARLVAMAHDMMRGDGDAARRWLASPEHSPTIEEMLSGEGALRYGGRWNSPGRRAVYLGGSLALASLELLVHLRVSDALKAYRKLPVGIPEDLVKVMNPADLPAGWARVGLHPVTQGIGDRWLDSLESAVLAVPSAVVIGEVNHIVNPGHPDFARLEPGTITDYRYDPAPSAPACRSGRSLPSGGAPWPPRA